MSEAWVQAAWNDAARSACRQLESGVLDIGEYKKARIRRSVDLWLGMDVPVHVHSTMNAVGSREIRILVEYAGTIFDKKRVADALASGIQGPGSRPRLRLILLDASTKPETEHARIRTLGEKI